MNEWRILRNADTNEIVLARTKWCASYWCKYRGLQLVPHLDDDEGLIFVESRESRAGTAIHMFFMRFSIAVVWLDRSGTVVDMRLAKPWCPAYTPAVPAQYYVEANPTLLERVKIGDRLRFDEAAPT